jgi:hypothetical protein
MPFVKRKKRPEISSPTNFEHRVHSGFDHDNGVFVGLPTQWNSIINEATEQHNHHHQQKQPSNNSSEINGHNNINNNNNNNNSNLLFSKVNQVVHSNGMNQSKLNDNFLFCSKNFNVVPFALPSRYHFWASFTDRYRFSYNVTLPLLTVTHRYNY